MSSYPRYLVVTKCICDTSKINISEFPELEPLLPEGYSYRVCELTRLDADDFVCRFRVNISSKDEAIAWFVKFQLATCTVFNKDRTFKENSTNIVYKVDMKCHHNTKPLKSVKNPDPRHTRCPARIGITVRHVKLSRHYQSTDIHLTEFPMTVILHHRHNHAIDYGAEKRFLDRLRPPELIPLLKQPEGPSMIQNLKEYIDEYNSERQGRFAELIIHDKENFFVTLVSPLMKRVLENVPETADVMFADSTVKIKPYGCTLFLLLTGSSFGGLPVGCILTTSDREDVFNRALENYKSFLNSNYYNGQGVLGPKVIFTDHRGSGKKSFRKAFPKATVSMCTYKVLQTAWRYTMNDNTGIPRERRLDFFCLLQQMLCCPSKEQLARLFDNIKTCPSITAYPKYISFVHKMYDSRQEWATCFKGKRKLAEQGTSKVCESAMRMVNENISKWKKAPSVRELFHFVASDTESFYENYLITMAKGRPISHLKKNFKMEDFSSEKVGANSYIVRSTKTNRLFCVDSEIGICSCLYGKFGGMCSHQILVSVKCGGGGPKTPDIDPDRRAKLVFIATGKDDVSNTPQSSVLASEIRPENISRDLSHAELDLSTFSPESDSESFEENDEDELLEEMEISYGGEIQWTPTGEMSDDHALLVSEDQNDSLEDTSYLQSAVQATQEQDVIASPMETAAESPRSTPVSSEVNAADLESDTAEMVIRLQAVFNDIVLRMLRSDETLHAVEDFVKAYQNLNSENSLNSAFRSFGKLDDSSS